ncbi:MAG: T9SS type A sorting domain-containing protein [Candidatus Electryonea clarkiae]|nr:T9SS type A sorting domain-containing protein [Candidatus Electryonea clarkiae]MDP8286063.1 T9SS type A sorting domain-containing protein [Candidatus Electryonea clarkiae]
MRNSIFLFILFFPTFIFAQEVDIIRTGGIGYYWDPPRQYRDISSIKICGEYAAVRTGSGLRIINISNPLNPVDVGNIFQDVIWDFEINQNYLVYQSLNHIRIVDISNPDSLSTVGSIRSHYESDDMYIEGSFIYKCGRDGTFSIHDISDPTSPQQRGSLDVDETGHNLKVSGEYAYYATDTYRDYQFRIIDISDPDNPSAEGSYQHNVDRFRISDFEVQDDFAYICFYNEDQVGSVRIVDISDPSTPELVGTFTNLTSEIDIYGDYMILRNINYLSLVDISDPGNPFRRSNFDIGLNLRASDTMIILNDYLIIVWSPYYMTIDISDPIEPHISGTIRMDNGTIHDVKVSGDYAYILDSNVGLRIADITDVSAPFETGYLEIPGFDSTNHDGEHQSLDVSGDYVYVCSDRGLFVIDASDRESPIRTGSLNIRSSCVSVSGDYAYCGNDIVDISDPSSPGRVSTFGVGDGFSATVDISVIDEYAYLFTSNRNYIYNVSDPLNPELTTAVDTYPPTTFGEASWSYAFTGTEGRRSTHIYDISDPDQMIRIGSYVGYVEGGIGINDSVIVVGSTNGGMRIVNFAHESGLCVTGISMPGLTPENGELVDNYAYTADRYYFSIYDISEGLPVTESSNTQLPSGFSISPAYPNPFNPSTTINIGLPHSTEINVTAFNSLGQKVAQLATGRYSAGNHNIIFNAEELSSGIYFIHANVPGKMNEVRKIVLVR